MPQLAGDKSAKDSDLHSGNQFISNQNVLSIMKIGMPFCVFIVLFTANLMFAQTAEQTSVQEIVNHDGSLRLERDGNYSLDGYELQIDLHGRPIVTPKKTMQTQSSAGSWGMGIGLPAGVNNTVYALAVYNGELYVGGNFTQAGGIAANRIARWNGTGWNTLGTGVNSTVYALAVYNGELYVGGGFTEAGSISANSIARWNGTSWNSVGTGSANGVSGTSAYVSEFAVYNGELYVGGRFTSAGGVAANHIARWDGTSWNSVGTGSANGVNNEVGALKVYNDELYVGGYFSNAGNLNVNKIARWDGTSWKRVGITYGVSGFASRVHVMEIYNGELYVGGSFPSAGGVTANGIARWDGTSWNSVGTGSANGVINGVYVGSVYTILVHNNELYVGGIFTEAGGMTARSIARWNGTAWDTVGTANALSSGSSPTVSAFAAFDGELYIGGSFTSAGGVSVNHIVRWNGTNWNAVGGGVNNQVTALAVYNGELYIGGGFTSAGGVSVNHIARWNGSYWRSVGIGAANGLTGGSVGTRIVAFAVYNGELYVGGNFTQAGGIAANRIARWNGTSWNSVGTGSANGVNGDVAVLAVYNGELYVGGSFTQAGGIAANRIARWNGTSWNSVGTGSANGVSGTSAYVSALAVYNGELYVGGDFTQAGGSFRLRIARWNGTSWGSLGNGTNGPVFALAVYNGSLFVGGGFTQVDGFNVLASRIARWNGTSWSAVGTPSNGVSGTYPAVYVMTTYNGELYVGGVFTTAGGIAANNLARWNGSTWDSVGTNGGNGTSGNVSTLALYNGSLFIGGYFSEVNVGNTIPAFRFAQWTAASGASASSANTVSGDGVFLFPPTGLSIAFTGISGSGSCAVERYDNSASNISFSSTPPMFVSQYRFVVSASGFSFTNAELRFNRNQIPNAGIGNAQTVTVYRRPTVGAGTFTALTNTYNSSFPDEVRATTTAFSEFVLGSDDNQLPVELIGFVGTNTNDGVLLSWRTASELNNAGFEVQRRSKMKEAWNDEWQTLGFVRGIGTSTQMQSYSFLDRTASGRVQYRLKQVDFDGQFEYSPIVEVNAGGPRTFNLSQNYPNPFNPTTTIQYQLPITSEVSLKIYDVLGKEVMTLVKSRQEAGQYNVLLNASNLASGIYFYRLQARSVTHGASEQGFIQTKKMMLVK